MSIVFDASVETGVAAIDDQHRNLAMLINRLGEALAAGDDQKTLSPMLDRVLQGMMDHALGEEALMARYSYPGYSQHRRKHVDLLSQVYALREPLDRGEKSIDIATVAYLEEWLMHHVDGADRELAAFLAPRMR